MTTCCSFVQRSIFYNPELSGYLFLIISLYRANGAEFKACVNFGTPDTRLETYHKKKGKKSGKCATLYEALQLVEKSKKFM